MGLSWLIAGGVKRYLALLPHDYAVKTARKLRYHLDRYSEDHDLIDSSVGPLSLSGLRRSIGEPAQIGLKEPETVRWIDACMAPGDILWDVGSNIGLYAVYAAKRGAGAVYAFEPFGPTYVQLVRNLIRNGCDKTVRALNLALSDRTGLASVTLRSFEPGYATTLAGHELPVDAAEQGIGQQSVMTFRADDLVRIVPEARPDHVKIDVDGSEPLVLAGLEPLLPSVRTILIEVLEEFEQAFERDFLPRLSAAGLQEAPIRSPRSARNRLFVRKEASGLIGDGL
jgi:FkbM family methyltransferase